MCYAMIGQLIAQGVQSAASGAQAFQNADEAKQAALINEARTRRAAVDAKERGQQDERNLRLQGGVFAAQQKNAMASSGFAMDSSSYGDIAGGTAALTEYEALLARSNAAREALGLEQQADDYKRQADAAQRAKYWAVANTLLGSATQSGQTVAAYQQDKAQAK